MCLLFFFPAPKRQIWHIHHYVRVYPITIRPGDSPPPRFLALSPPVDGLRGYILQHCLIRLISPLSPTDTFLVFAYVYARADCRLLLQR